MDPREIEAPREAPIEMLREVGELVNEVVHERRIRIPRRLRPLQEVSSSEMQRPYGTISNERFAEQMAIYDRMRETNRAYRQVGRSSGPGILVRP